MDTPEPLKGNPEIKINLGFDRVVPIPPQGNEPPLIAIVWRPFEEYQVDKALFLVDPPPEDLDTTQWPSYAERNARRATLPEVVQIAARLCRAPYQFDYSLVARAARDEARRGYRKTNDKNLKSEVIKLEDWLDYLSTIPGSIMVLSHSREGESYRDREAEIRKADLDWVINKRAEMLKQVPYFSDIASRLV